MVNNVPIYSSSGIGQIVGYRDLFHERMMPNIRKCVSTLERENLMHLVSNMAEKLVNRPFYNHNYGHGREDIDALRFFFSQDNAKYINEVLLRFNKLVNRAKKQPHFYLAASEDSLLYLMRDIFATTYKVNNYNKIKIEKKFFKSLYAANQITCERGGGVSPYTLEDNPELFYAATMLRQFSSNNYHDNHMLLVTQTIKCIRFFEFAAKHTELSKMVPLFCQKYGLDNKWWCYPKAIWELECIFNSHIGEIDFAKCKMPDDNITYRVAIESSLDVNDFVSKKENRDFTKFRSRPLIRMDETRFFLFNHNLWIEHIYNSLYFDFREIAEKEFGFKGQDFNRLYTTDFSEGCLFTQTLKGIFLSHSNVNLCENECIEIDKSKDAKNCGAPDFYARYDNFVFLFENKDIKLKDYTKECGKLKDYLDFLYLNLVRSDKGKPKGVGQLLKNVQRIRTGEFQKRWDPNCPKDAIVYPILVLADVKQTMNGVKNLLQNWQVDEYPHFSIDGSNIMPVVLTDIATLCLFAKTFSNKNFKSYLDDYYKKSSIDYFIKSNELTDLFNGLASFPEYMKTQNNEGIVDFSKHWEDYIRK